eukprot:jgi/Galph1/5649/GphlegSOOS_G4280.1
MKVSYLCTLFLSFSFVYLKHIQALPYNNASNVIELDSEAFKRQVVGSSDNWLLEFYAPWCGYCQKFEPVYKKVAFRLKDAVKVGAVNGEKYPELAQKYQVRGYPTILLFRLSNKKSKILVEYQGDRSSKSLLQFVEERIPLFVAQLRANGMASFLDNQPHMPHVLLATEKQQPSLFLKALSATYASSIVFGMIQKKDMQSLEREYSIDKYPVFLAFTGNSTNATHPWKIPANIPRKDIHILFQQLINQPWNLSSFNISKLVDVAGSMFEEKVVYDFYYSSVINRVQPDNAGGEEYRHETPIFHFVAIEWEHCPTTWLKAFEIEVPRNETMLVAWKINNMKYATTCNIKKVSSLQNFMDRLVGGDIRLQKLPTSILENNIRYASSTAPQLHDEV